MTWLQTYTGKALDLLDPRADQIDPVDIAISLARTCRYHGMTLRHYSVAEHSCLLHDWAVAEGLGSHAPLKALLHDAHEAYVGDLPSPVKRALSPAALDGWLDLTNAIDRAIAARFGLSTLHHPDVKRADTRILLDERDALMGPPPRDWGIDDHPLGITIHGWDVERARCEFRYRLARWTR